MIRKQLYITPEQDRALKQHAREQGVSEAALVREALDRHLHGEDRPFLPEHRRQALEALIKGNEKLAGHLRFPKGYTFDREEGYAERERRWYEDRKGRNKEKP